MSTATTAPPTDTAGKMRAINAELSQELYERRDHLEAMSIGDLAGVNTFLLGPPGTAKSLLVRKQCERVIGARYWETLLDRQLPMETLFGPVDIIEFEKSGNWHRRVDGYLPTAHKAFLDEVGKAGPAVLNPLLTVLNEGIYHNNSVPMQCNLISAVGASNEELELPELSALWDRWMIRMMVEPIVEPGNFAALLQGAQKQATAQPTTITLDELVAAREDVKKIVLPTGVVDTIMQLKADLRGQQVEPSDRRWRQSVTVLQASAYYNGRSAIDEDDLAILRHVLWDVVEQISTVEKKVLSLSSPITKAALDLQAQIDKIASEIDALKGQSTENRAVYGSKANNTVAKITSDLAKTRESANRQGRSTARLDTVGDSLKNVKIRIFVECLNMPADRASQMT